MQQHRFTMNYQKARCNTQHQPPPYASTGTQRGYVDFRPHLPYTTTSIYSWSKLFMCCLLYTRYWIDLNKDFHHSDATWAPACSTSTYKNIKTLHFWSVVSSEEPLFTNGFPHKGSVIRKTFPWCDVSCRVLFNPIFISVFSCDVSDWLWTDWEPMSRVHVQMGSVMSSYYHKHNGCSCSDVGYTQSHQQSLSDSNISSVFETLDSDKWNDKRWLLLMNTR